MTDGKQGARHGAGQGNPVIDPSLQDRVAEAAAEVDQCFAALGSPLTPGQLDALRAATDRLMRACARVLIELGQAQDETPAESQ